MTAGRRVDVTYNELTFVVEDGLSSDGDSGGSIWNGKREVSQNTPGCNLLQVCEDRLFSDVMETRRSQGGIFTSTRSKYNGYKGS